MCPNVSKQECVVWHTSLNVSLSQSPSAGTLAGALCPWVFARLNFLLISATAGRYKISEEGQGCGAAVVREL